MILSSVCLSIDMSFAFIPPHALNKCDTLPISAIRNVDTNASLAAFHCRWCCNISRNRLISLIGVLFAMWLSLYKTPSCLLLQLFVLYLVERVKLNYLDKNLVSIALPL
jgi:hypothetical protein